MHAYEHQDSTQTLEQGIAEYYAVFPQLSQQRNLSPAAQSFFRCHDTAHVVFGCSIALEDEAVVKIASLFGTSAGFGVLRGYRLHESTDIYRRLTLRDMVRAGVKSLVRVPRTIMRCRRQRRRWPWDDFDRYLQVPLCDIRRDFGIRVAHFGAKGAGREAGNGRFPTRV
jgi:hypothetical protein